MRSPSRESVLLVDDEPQVLVALEDVLGDDFTILKAGSAEGALAIIDREPGLAVIVTDQRMPRMSGDELLASLGKSCEATRILVTAFADLSAVIRAVNDGDIFAYVTKPWDAQDLRLKVQKGAERFRLGKELAYERQLLRDLMDNIPDGIYFKNRDLQLLRRNRAFSLLTGAAPIDAGDGRGDDVLAASRPTDADAEERRILAEGAPALDVVREYRLGDRKRWLSETKAPIRGPDGAIIGLVGISRDVTARLETAEALRASEARLREQTGILNSVLDSMSDGVVVTNRGGHFILFNPQAEALLGLGPLDVPVGAWAETYGAFLPDGKALVPTDQLPLVRAMAGEEMAEVEMLIRNANVAGTRVVVTATPLRGDGGARAGGVAVIRDVTQHRLLEEQLRQSQKMDAVGQLAGGVAHDFNNMLFVIGSYCDLLLADLPPDDPRRDDVGEMQAAVRRATALTRQLLTFSRKQIVQPTVLDLNQVVASFETMLRRFIGEDIDLRTALSPTLGSVRSDAGQIEQILMNLVINARHAMPDGGHLLIETANVTFDDEYAGVHAGTAPGQFVMLGVTDTGTGMDAETQKHIFEPFFTTKEVGRGTGLGLSTVYGIVRQNDGHVWVYSEVGGGTSFKIYLPRWSAAADGATPSRPAARLARLAGMILLVEDDDAVAQVAARILRNQKHTVLVARRASDARRLCAEHGARIDLLLTDVVMPEISGPNLAKELLGVCPTMGVLYMSGYSGTAIRAHGSLEPGVPFVEKPFSAATLTDKVQEMLEARP